MFSSAEHFAGAGVGDNQLLMQHHHGQDNVGQMYHVPQHSRREKLRFQQEEQLPPSPSAPLLLLHDPNAAVAAAAPVNSTVAPFYHANSLTPFLPSSSSSSSPPCSSNSSAFYYANHNPGYGGLATATQYLGQNVLADHSQQAQNHISTQGFSLSLSSSFPVPPPRPLLGSRPVPIGPFTGYSAVLSRCRYLESARKLLEEVCDVGHVAAVGGDDGGDKEMMLLEADPSLDVSALVDHGTGCRKGNCDPVIPNTEQQWKKTRLISMLDEVYRRYKQYYQQVQAVMTSFEAVAGLGNAAPFALMALKAMSKHFRSLKNIISDQLRQTNKVLGRDGPGREETPSFGHPNGGGCLQRASAYNPGAFSQPHVWRPQRGLPERAVAVLRAWLFEHFLHPYPTDTDKQILAKQTGLTRNQVSNWFINARVRLWKPMVEEIHNLEMRQKNKVAPAENDCSTDQQSQVASSSNATPFSGQLPGIPSSRENARSMPKNVQEELIQMPNHMQQQLPMNFSYDSLSNPHHYPVGVDGVGNGRNAGVSLTLGLHQDSGISFSEQLPLNVARRFGLEECSDAYVVNSFGGQERLFAKDASGRLLHDFVG